MHAGVDDLGNVHGRLRDAILNGHLQPESQLSQVDLARQLRVSRAPLREALRMLEREGLVEPAPKRQSRVAPMSAQALDELYGTRIMLESLAVALTVPRLTERDQYALSEALAEMNVLGRARSVDRWEAPHRRFHRLLVSRAGKRSTGLIDELSDHSERYRRRYLEEPRGWTTALEEHAEIADACHQRNAELTSQRLCRHLARTALTLVMQIAPGYEPAAVRAALRLAVGGREHDNPEEEGSNQ